MFHKTFCPFDDHLGNTFVMFRKFIKLMSIDADSNVRVASIAKVRESSRQDEEDENVEDPESEENEDGEITE